jgi:hypothetical protein
MDPPVRMGVVVTSILHESIHGLLYFYLSHFILQSVKEKSWEEFLQYKTSIIEALNKMLMHTRDVIEFEKAYVTFKEWGPTNIFFYNSSDLFMFPKMNGRK